MPGLTAGQHLAILGVIWRLTGVEMQRVEFHRVNHSRMKMRIHVCYRGSGSLRTEMPVFVILQRSRCRIPTLHMSCRRTRNRRRL